jgi:Arc/MetJ-type ribon-helix-helix transcriptional regulator
MTSWRELRLPEELCQKIEEQIQGSQFATLEEFLTFLLREVASRNSSKLDEQERQTIEQRLRDLGYM